MKAALKRYSSTFSLLVAAIVHVNGAGAQNYSGANPSIPCLEAPEISGCDEPTVDMQTTATISPAFPNATPSCEKVTNSCAFDFAVPAAEQEEWTSFLSSKFVNTADSCASVAPCGEPGICGGSNGQTYVMRCGGIHIGGINTGMTEGCLSGSLTGAGEYSPNGGLDQIYYWTCQGADGGASANCEWDFHSCLAG